MQINGKSFILGTIVGYCGLRYVASVKVAKDLLKEKKEVEKIRQDVKEVTKLIDRLDDLQDKA